MHPNDYCFRSIDYLLLDVREPWDYTKSHITTAVNAPYPLLVSMPPPIVIAKLVDVNSRAVKSSHSGGDVNREDDKAVLARRLIFHCTLSLVRGPTAAVKVRWALDTVLRDRARREEVGLGAGVEIPEISVLDGGFVGWSRRYGKGGEEERRYLVGNA
ncbi:uncharacterized protein EV422DRAFT_285302 [Fimicolochytrium jonesii]|uniref:uncharacterized protein n=1 Tax=Fimicolochytrium jonesii TaxID=1396493 RepID=UPI0022FE0071|nr:uncharacterized protein EV422DRAFT_285302 [Fimicolochytrium jonesii]KAI8816489.1 hypothetical protein EV422DRAFT_285302 [Fimicolochytrium jonesii]